MKFLVLLSISLLVLPASARTATLQTGEGDIGDIAQTAPIIPPFTPPIAQCPDGTTEQNRVEFRCELDNKKPTWLLRMLNNPPADAYVGNASANFLGFITFPLFCNSMVECIPRFRFSDPLSAGAYAGFAQDCLGKTGCKIEGGHCEEIMDGSVIVTSLYQSTVKGSDVQNEYYLEWNFKILAEADRAPFDDSVDYVTLVRNKIQEWKSADKNADLISQISNGLSLGFSKMCAGELAIGGGAFEKQTYDKCNVALRENRKPFLTEVACCHTNPIKNKEVISHD